MDTCIRQLDVPWRVETVSDPFFLFDEKGLDVHFMIDLGGRSRERMKQAWMVSLELEDESELPDELYNDAGYALAYFTFGHLDTMSLMDCSTAYTHYGWTEYPPSGLYEHLHVTQGHKGYVFVGHDKVVTVQAKGYRLSLEPLGIERHGDVLNLNSKAKKRILQICSPVALSFHSFLLEGQVGLEFGETLTEVKSVLGTSKVLVIDELNGCYALMHEGVEWLFENHRLCTVQYELARVGDVYVNHYRVTAQTSYAEFKAYTSEANLIYSEFLDDQQIVWVTEQGVKIYFENDQVTTVMKSANYNDTTS